MDEFELSSPELNFDTELELVLVLLIDISLSSVFLLEVMRSERILNLSLKLFFFTGGKFTTDRLAVPTSIILRSSWSLILS